MNPPGEAPAPRRMPPAHWARAVAMAAAGLALAAATGPALARALQPLLAAATGWWSGELELQTLAVAAERGQAVLAAQFMLARTVVIEHQALVPDGALALAGATAGTVWQPVLAAAVLLAAWPGTASQHLRRALVALPLLLAVLCADVPASLAALAWRGLRASHGLPVASALQGWDAFLQGGGRLVLGLAVAVLAVAVVPPTSRGSASTQRER